MKPISAIVLLFFFFTSQSQTGIDSFSVNRSGNNREIQDRISAKEMNLAKMKLELGELQKKLVDKTSVTNQAARQADESINNNVEAAVKLQKKSSKKKYAKRAKKTAKRAKRETREYQSSKSELKRLRKSIEKKEKTISREERELEQLRANVS